MTTSGVYSFSVSRDQIIRQAMLTIGKLDESEVPTAQETTDCALFLNMLVKQWQGKADFAPGLKTWTRKHGHLFLSSTTGAYTIGPGATGWTNAYTSTTTTTVAAASQAVIRVTVATGIVAGYQIGVELDSGALFWSTVLSVVGLVVTLNSNLPSQASASSVIFSYQTTAQQPVVIETAFLRDINSNDVPLNFLTVQQYDFLPSKTNLQAISDPTSIYYEFNLTNSTLYTDVPGAEDVTKHICLTYMEAVQDFVNPNDTPYYPQEYYLPLALGLAKIIAPTYRVKWSPNMQENYAMALGIAQQKEPETTVMFFQSGGE